MLKLFLNEEKGFDDHPVLIFVITVVLSSALFEVEELLDYCPVSCDEYPC